MEDVPSGESVGVFQILRSDHLPVKDQVRQTGGIFAQLLHYRVAKCVAPAFPITVFQLERRILNIDRHYMMAVRRERRIGKRWNRDLKVRMRREVAVLGFVEGALQIIDFRANLDASAKRVAVAILQCGKTW